jgi:hypothetical protein
VHCITKQELGNEKNIANVTQLFYD